MKRGNNMTRNMSMTDRNGNTINNGDTVNIIIAGEFQHKAIFQYASSDDYATIIELGVRFRTGGKQAYGIGCLTKYIYKAV